MEKDKKSYSDLLKLFWRLIGLILFLIITVTTFIKYNWYAEQPSNFTMLIIILMAISLNENRK